MMGENALVGQERRHVAIGDLLRQAFDDGRLPHARLADQHRIILGAAAQDLNHTIQFAVAAHQRVEMAVGRGLGQVAAEFGKQRAFLGPVGGCLLRIGARNILADLR
jgi:hypothetical protein